MANPLARVVMDQMSRKHRDKSTNTGSNPVEETRNLDTEEERMIAGVIHGSRKKPETGTSRESAGKHRGKKVALEDLVKEPTSKEYPTSQESPEENRPSGTKNKASEVKNPYHKGGVKSSVIANPGKDVSSVALKSLGKGNG